MQYSSLVEFYSRLEATSKRIEMTNILSELFSQAEPDELEHVIYLTQGKIHPDWKGEPEIGMAEKMVVDAIVKASGLKKKNIEEKLSESGDIGLTAEASLKKKQQVMLGSKKLTVSDVYTALDHISNESGKGSGGRKIDQLVKIMVNISPLGARYLSRTVVGALRLGVGDMTILDALSLAYTGSSKNREQLERAYNLTSDLGAVARTLAVDGIEIVAKAQVVLGKPIRMMLAQRLNTPEETIEKLGACSAEYKLDGERFQIHKNEDEIQIFSRRLENITYMYPDAVKMVLTHITAKKAIIEGEAVAIDADSGVLKSFQTLMQRRRKYKIEEMAEKFPIAIFLFECLYVDGHDLTLESYTRRRNVLSEIVEENDQFRLVRALQTEETASLIDFFEEAISDGMEGLVVKSTSTDSIYRAGARSWLWVKLKASYQSKMVEAVDLVVVGAFHGRGRRAGSYGALLLASYDPENDVYQTVCKVGSGFTDANLEEIPKMLAEDLTLEKPRNVDSLMDAEVWFNPRIVMEVIGDEITLSPVHTSAFGILREESGLAIRFPRFQRFRYDKSAEDATTADEIINMYQMQSRTV